MSCSPPDEGSISVHLNRNGATLDSVDATVTSHSGDGIQLEVFYRAPGDSTGHTVVYRGWVAAKNMSPMTAGAPSTPTGSLGPTGIGRGDSSWSGTLSPSDWKSGCQDGLYWIGIDVDLSSGFDADFNSERFSCTGS